MRRFLMRVVWTAVALVTVLMQAPSFWRASAKACDRLDAKWKERQHVARPNR